MDKRATRQITLYSILFLVMLFFSGITFFLGLQFGVDETEEKYAYLLVEEVSDEDYQYQQQDLVSFYYTTFSAFEQFQVDWFESIQAINSNQVSNPANVFDELATKAAKQAELASSTSMKGLGLLNDAQQNYIRSLNQFKEASQDIKKATNKKSSAEAMTIINNDNNYKLAKEQALLAQKQYFEAMHKWSISIDSSIPTTFDHTISQSISVWENHPLIVKLQIIANYLDEQNIYKNALPQDYVSRIDDFIVNGQAKELNLTSINQVLDLLFATEAVRSGDFSQYKGTRYENEFLPSIPFIKVN